MQTKVANDARKMVQDPLLVQHHHVAHPGLWVVQPQSILMENVHHRSKFINKRDIVSDGYLEGVEIEGRGGEVSLPWVSNEYTRRRTFFTSSICMCWRFLSAPSFFTASTNASHFTGTQHFMHDCSWAVFSMTERSLFTFLLDSSTLFVESFAMGKKNKPDSTSCLQELKFLRRASLIRWRSLYSCTLSPCVPMRKIGASGACMWIVLSQWRIKDRHKPTSSCFNISCILKHT